MSKDCCNLMDSASDAKEKLRSDGEKRKQAATTNKKNRTSSFRGIVRLDIPFTKPDNYCTMHATLAYFERIAISINSTG